MGKYNVVPTLIAAREANRADDEANYIKSRRAIVDPRNDREAADKEAARNANIVQYGPQAADPTSYGQLEGIKQRKELHPGEVAQSGLRTDSMKQSNADATTAAAEKAAEAARAGMGRLYSAMQAAGVNDRSTANAWLAAQSPENLQRITGQPTDPAKVPLLLDQLDSAPGGFVAGLRAQRAAVGTPERYKQVISGIGPDGKPVNMAVSEDQAPGALDVKPDDRLFDQQRRQGEATIRATDRSNIPKAAAGAKTPEEQQMALDSLMTSIDDMKTVLGEASRTGAITNDQGDTVSNLFTGDNPAGRFVGNLTGDPKETLRTQIDNKATALLNALIHMDGSTSSRLFDSNTEKEMWLKSLGVGGSYQARVKAVEDFQRLAQSRMKDPRRLAKAPLGEPATQGQPAQPEQVGGGNLQQRQDGVYVWSPGTD